MIGSEKPRILIVEDERSIALTLAYALRQAPEMHWTVDVCYTAYEALVLFLEAPFNLVISDLRLPGMSGFELLAKIRARYPRTRTILMTGFGSAEAESQARQLSDAYLTKPFEPSDMLKLARDLTAQTCPIARTA